MECVAQAFEDYCNVVVLSIHGGEQGPVELYVPRDIRTSALQVQGPLVQGLCASVTTVQ